MEAVLKVETAPGEGGPELDREDMVLILAVPGESVVSLWDESWSGCGTGRRLASIEEAADAADMGSVTTLFLGGVAVGSAGGGDGGGECW